VLGAGGVVAAVVGAASGGENATGDAEVMDLMDVADAHDEAVDGQRSLFPDGLI
jgi:hypothetical protein